MTNVLDQDGEAKSEGTGAIGLKDLLSCFLDVR